MNFLLRALFVGLRVKRAAGFNPYMAKKREFKDWTSIKDGEVRFLWYVTFSLLMFLGL